MIDPKDLLLLLEWLASQRTMPGNVSAAMDRLRDVADPERHNIPRDKVVIIGGKKYIEVPS